MNNVNAINYSVNKLLYYNFMENFLNFIKMSFVRYDTNFLQILYDELFNKLLLQIFTKLFDSYITFIIPYGRYKSDNGKNVFIEEYIEYNDIEEINSQTIQCNEENKIACPLRQIY
ncbi:conserved Plasmodium protein, unknown function [Plasmodium sp. DRC-Itaito]|nr:conserved Plasmodium protein, unknown function [Plasmodium sp. DRC-Itaito]